MFPTFISILDIQSWWEVPSIAHFCSLFRSAFNLLDFDIEDLEEALLNDGTEESSWLQELIVLLLKGCLPENEISLFNYQMFLRRLFRQKCQEHDIVNPFNTDIDFQVLPLRVKVDILHTLCDFRLEAIDVIDQLKNFEADSLRVEPIGYDINKSAYWYFYGTRLYREDNPESEKAIWQVICFSLNDWEQLVKKFEHSTSKRERQLFQVLHENFIPELPRLFREKENLARKRLLDRLPRRTSNRIKIKEKTDEDLVRIETKNLRKEEFMKKELEHQKELRRIKKKEIIKSENLKNLRSKRFKDRLKLKELTFEDQSETSEDRYEMAGKAKDKKSKAKTLKEIESIRHSGRNNPKSPEKSSKNAGQVVKSVGRQTNNSLASATGQILIHPLPNPHRKKLKTSQVFSQTEEDLQTGLHKILDHVKNHDDAWPFIDPVEEEYAPNYYSIIRKPMDLQRMEERLDSGHYKTFSRFKTDFQLIVNNCRLYNGVDNEYTEMVDNLLEDFNRAVERYLDHITSSDEDIAVEFPNLVDDDKSNKRPKSEQKQTKKKPTLSAQTDSKKPTRDSDEILEEEEDSHQESEDDVKSTKKNAKPPKKEKLKLNKKDKENVKVNKKRINQSENRDEVKSKKRKVEDEIEVPKTKKHKTKENFEEKETKFKKSEERGIKTKENKNSDKAKDIPKVSKNEKISTKKDKDDVIKKSKKIDEKITKNNKNENKKSNKSLDLENKNRKTKKNLSSSSRSRSISRSLSRGSSSPPPSWPPSSPEHNYNFSSKKKNYSSEEDNFSPNGKQKPNNDKWKEVFKEDIFDKNIDRPPSPIKHKDKHNKLLETIEKLKAKSDLSKLNDNIYDFGNEITKDTYNNKKKVDTKKKKIIADLIENEDNSGSESIYSENKNKSKKKEKETVNKNTSTKDSTIEALTLATEQTLKDINKWLDDTSKFPEFSSASNSPSHFAAIEEFDNLDKKKLDKPVLPRKEVNVKDPKKRPFQRDPSKIFRRREVQRTIDRLQPGKSKGNLITNVQNPIKQDDLFPLGPLSKIKDAKNSLIVKTDESAPKLSLGSVLDSFGKHKFVDDEAKKEDAEDKVEPVKEDIDKIVTKESEVKKEEPKKEEVVIETPKLDNSPGKATPNLSAWFKAFGSPKVQPPTKKSEKEEKIETEVKKEDNAPKKISLPDPSPNPDSPLMHGHPIPRQRKISTGSSMSERSSFSQDLDSPRVGIDERMGVYPAPYPSPLHKSPSGASPNLRSPRPDVSPKSAAYSFNGQMRVGFYQDTVSTKSSPDKSCSPRDNPQSPYAQYSEHVYAPPTTHNPSYSYSNPYYSHPPNYSTADSTPPYNTEPTTQPAYYDTTKSLTDQYQAKNTPTSPLSIKPDSSPAPSQQSPSINTQQPSPAIDTYKKTQPSPNVEIYHQQNSPVTAPYQNEQIPPTVDTYRQNPPPKYPNQQPPIDMKYTQVLQEDFSKINQQPTNNLELFRQQSSGNVDNFRPQPTTNLDNFRPAQAAPPNVEPFRNEVPCREKLQAPTTFPVKKRAYTEVEQNNRFEEQFNRSNLDINLMPNRLNSDPGINTREPMKYIHQNIPEPRNMSQQSVPQQVAISTQETSLNIRNPNFPAPNPYNYNEAYPISIPNAGRSMESDRKVDLTKYTNMGYTGSEMNFSRNPQQYMKPEITYSKPAVSVSSEQPNIQRYPENNIINYKQQQTNHLSGGTAQAQETSRITSERLEPVPSRLAEVTIPKPTYSAAAASLDIDIRGNLANLTQIVDRYQNDERMLSGLQPNVQSYYADKTIPSQHMFPKPIATSAPGIPMFSQVNTNPYSHNIDSTSTMYNRQMTELQNSNMINNPQERTNPIQVPEKKSKKRKSKTATAPTSIIESSVNTTQAQGFQSYTGLKNSSSMEPSAISLKTASVVPGSAFNFGPAATGLGLSSGLYSDKDAYTNFLDDFRAAPNYYMAAAAAAHHRSTPENGDKAARTAHQSSNPQTPGYPFLGAPQSRPPSYPIPGPFMPPHQGSLMDTSSPLYPQYLQPGVLHHLPPGAYPTGYHPALSMRQPYDSMTRPSWL